MKRRLISLRTAILTPFVLVVFTILAIFTFFWSSDYNYLVKEQGTKILTAMNLNTIKELDILLSEPLRINELFASTIMNNHLYGKADVEGIEDLSREYLMKIAPSLSQVSVVSYGDVKKNFIGVRVNSGEKNYSLMLQDSRTNGKLNIYEADTIDSKVVASYEGYDPTTRPWFAPVAIDPHPMWSEIYVNVDEKMEATISSLVPVFDENNVFKGVADIDVKLSGINEYLKAVKTKGSGVIYIVDQDWKVIAHSGTEDVMKVIPGTTPTAEMVSAKESENALVRGSAAYLMDHKSVPDRVEKLKLSTGNHFALITRMIQPESLDWRVVVVIPEKDLMGSVKQRQSTILIIMLCFGILGILLGAYILSAVIRPVLKSANAAKKISEGNWDTTVERKNTIIYETDLLVVGFNAMSEKIRDSFDKLLAAQDEIERLHITEKTNLEAKVNEKTEELTLAMKELAEREKLASLGGLVSGIAHEINTPLGVAVSAGSLLENVLGNAHKKIMDGKMTKSDFVSSMESMNESVTIINSNLNRASSLVKSFKQIAVNQSIEEVSPFFVQDYIDAILLSLKHVLKHRNHDIQVLCPNDLEINSFPGAFSQILTNLIMNSLTHGFEEHQSGNIRIQVETIEKQITLLYEDDGRGIPPEVLPRIFDPFFTTNRSKGGSGLGLNIVYNIVTNQLNGKITCTSEVNAGTQFRIEFPAL